MTENNQTENITFTPQEFTDVSKYLMGSSVKLYPTIHVPQISGPARIQPQAELHMQRVIESCPFKSGMSFVVGGALGAFMGLFSSSIAPHHTVQVSMNDILLIQNHHHILTFQMSTRETLMDMKRTIVSNAKGFAFIGFVFAGI